MKDAPHDKPRSTSRDRKTFVRFTDLSYLMIKLTYCSSDLQEEVVLEIYGVTLRILLLSLRPNECMLASEDARSTRLRQVQKAWVSLSFH